MLTILALSSSTVYPVQVPSVNLAQLIQERGQPGIIPSPDLLERYRASGLPPPRVADWPAPLPDNQPVTGTRNILVIRIDFPDNLGTQVQAYYQNLIFGTSQGQLRHYYTEVSYGLLTITGTVTASWVRSTRNMVWWGADSGSNIDVQNADIFELAREAVLLADATINFATYDTNSNGVIDPDELSLCIVHAGNAQESTGVATDIWSHRWYIFGQGYSSRGVLLSDTFVDGKRISKRQTDNVGGYTMQAETSPMGTFAHEFGHDLGLPDLYDLDFTSDGVGYWCLMSVGSWLGSPRGSSPAHPVGWCKARLGWITPTAVPSGTSIPVRQIETYQSQSLYRLTITSTQYFLIENRQRTGYDSYLLGSGILIWHVDDSKTNNTNDADRWVDLEEAHGGIQHLDNYTDGNSGDANDPFYFPQRTSFADGTDPSSRSKAGSFTGIGVTNIGASGATMTFDLALPYTTVTTTTTTTATTSSTSTSYVSTTVSLSQRFNTTTTILSSSTSYLTSLTTLNSGSVSTTYTSRTTFYVTSTIPSTTILTSTVRSNSTTTAFSRTGTATVTQFFTSRRTVGNTVYVDVTAQSTYVEQYLQRVISTLVNWFNEITRIIYNVFVTETVRDTVVRVGPGLGSTVTGVFSSNSSLGFLMTGNIYDDSGIGFIYAHRGPPRILFPQTDSVRINQTTKAPTWIGYTNLVMVGGRAANPTTRYYEDNGLAPVRAVVNSNGTISILRGGTLQLNVRLSSINQSNDYFVMQVLSDGARKVVILWGIQQWGTYAAGVYFDGKWFADMASLTAGWYIIRWQDLNGNGIPDYPGEFTGIASGT
jgi:immune inhibitor A